MCCRYYYSDAERDEKLKAINAAMQKKYLGKYKMGEIFPSDHAPALIERGGKIIALPACFGFPGFTGGKPILNARSETAAEKKTFADSLRSCRMIIPATGFFEWSHYSGDKTKYLLTADSMRTIYMCAIYKVIDGDYRFVILTRSANESMAELHDRMPVIIGERDVRPYLESWSAAQALIASASPVLSKTPA